MKKNDLKQMIKPLVKECIHEVLIEEGLLSNVVAEVTKGLQAGLIVEHQELPPRAEAAPVPEPEDIRKHTEAARQKIHARRRELMDSIGADAYNGVNLFEGSTPMPTDSGTSQGEPNLGSPTDSGVDISSLVGGAKQIWGAMK